MDLLDDILDTLDLRGALYFRTDFTPPWSIEVPYLDGAARFHLVVQGHCHVRWSAGESALLGPGDLILLPRGSAHVIADDPDRAPTTLERVLADANYDGEGVLAIGSGDDSASTQLVCGHFTFRRNAEHPLINALPDHLILRAAARAGEPWLDDMLRMIPRRLFAGNLGSQAAATRLSEVVFIEMLRVGITQNSQMGVMMKAMQDRMIGRSLKLIHLRPQEPWTVDRLAREIGMSRSRFAERFRELMDTSPMAYLADWRLQKALALLDRTRQPVQQVAAMAGYQSPAAFTRAFSGKFGVSPTAYRRG